MSLDPKVRLTKGYRNKLRAYQHILNTKRGDANGETMLRGHLGYASQVDRRLRELYAEGLPVAEQPRFEIDLQSLQPVVVEHAKATDDATTAFGRFIRRVFSRLR